jgi:hypothetical protein
MHKNKKKFSFSNMVGAAMLAAPRISQDVMVTLFGVGVFFIGRGGRGEKRLPICQ